MSILDNQSGHRACKSSFLQAVGKKVITFKLGDLLVTSGLIHQGQLAHALILQKEQRLPLGKVLLREGYISRGTLYQKLAEQMCLRASIAGVALMMYAFPASAEETQLAALENTGVRLAAAFSPAAIKPSAPARAFPQIFSSTEIRSNDISAFTKWTSVMERFERQMASSSGDARIESWKEALASMKQASAAEQVRRVNQYVNDIRYIEDVRNYGKTDQWATPMEFFSKGGDCEDYAIAKYASLRALGFSTDQMRIAIVQDKIKNIPHALLIVHTDEGTFVLDNQDKRTRQVDQVTRYKPIFSINSTNWWLHKA